MAIVRDHAGVMEGALDYRELVGKNSPTIVQFGSHDGVLDEEYGLQELLVRESCTCRKLIEQ